MAIIINVLYLGSSGTSGGSILMSHLELVLQMTLFYQILGVIFQRLELDNYIILNGTWNAASSKEGENRVIYLCPSDQMFPRFYLVNGIK